MEVVMILPWVWILFKVLATVAAIVIALILFASNLLWMAEPIETTATPTVEMTRVLHKERNQRTVMLLVVFVVALYAIWFLL